MRSLHLPVLLLAVVAAACEGGLLGRWAVRRFVACLLVAGAACTPHYERLVVSLHGVPGQAADGVVVTQEKIEVPVGVALLITLRPEDSRGDPYEPDEFDVSSVDASIAAIFPTDEDWEYLLIGADIGETCIRVSLVLDEIACVPVEVVAG